ncbi:MAG: glycosyltransferase family 4 protein [candidate division Zixibacteria bacterium]|nr:glycosyltransferase family 4 protein [candidate division Zixibacteria bacterium]
MNLLYLNSIETKTFGGMEEWIRLTASGLAERGHCVTVAGRPDSELLRRVSMTSSDVDLLPLNISGDFNPVTIVRLLEYLKEQRTDVVVVNFNKDIRLGGLAAKLKRHAKVIWRVGVDLTKDNFIHRYLTPRLVDGVIVPSHALKKQIIRLGYIKDENVEVIHNGIAERDFSRPDKEASRLLRAKYDWPINALIAVTVGRLVDEKGHRHLIKAARQIVQKNQLARFIFIGDGYLRDELQELVEKYGLSDKIVFTGMLTEFDQMLAGADMMIHPSIEEWFPAAVLEGMRAGLPIVATTVGGIPEAVEENECAVLVPPNAPDSLGIVVADLMNDDARRAEMGRAGRDRWHRHFRVETMIDRVENHLRAHCESGEYTRG